MTNGSYRFRRLHYSLADSQRNVMLLAWLNVCPSTLKPVGLAGVCVRGRKGGVEAGLRGRFRERRWRPVLAEAPTPAWHTMTDQTKIGHARTGLAGSNGARLGVSLATLQLERLPCVASAPQDPAPGCRPSPSPRKNNKVANPPGQTLTVAGPSTPDRGPRDSCRGEETEECPRRAPRHTGHSRRLDRHAPPFRRGPG